MQKKQMFLNIMKIYHNEEKSVQQPLMNYPQF